MSTHEPATRPRPTPTWGDGVFAPISFAGYITWAAVTISAVDWARLADGLVREGLGLACLLLFVTLFVVRAHFDGSDTENLRRCTRLALLQGLAAVAAVWLLRSGTASVLLIIVAGQLFAMSPRGRALVWMTLFNLAVALCWLEWMSWNSVLLNLLPVLGFQAFAALTAHYAVSVERARDELARVNTQLLATQALLDESARSEERLKLSRELHDVAGHKLTALKLNLARLGRDPALAGREEIAVSGELANELLDDIRAVVSELRKHDGIDLRVAIESMTRQIPGPRFAIDIADDARVDSVQTAEALLRCAQEGITNAVRHGHPSRIAIECRRRDGAIELHVRDDGATHPDLRFGNGLTGMRERLEALGGWLQVAPVDGRGVELVARLPARS